MAEVRWIVALTVVLILAGTAGARTVEKTYVGSAPVSVVAAEVPVLGEPVSIGGVRIPVLPGETAVRIDVFDQVTPRVYYRIAFVDDSNGGAVIATAASCGTWIGPIPALTESIWVVPDLAPLGCLPGAYPAFYGQVRATFS